MIEECRRIDGGVDSGEVDGSVDGGVDDGGGGEKTEDSRAEMPGTR